MKIIRAEHQDNLGGGMSAEDVYFDNGFAVRICEGHAFLFLPGSDEELEDSKVLQMVAFDYDWAVKALDYRMDEEPAP